MSLRTLHAGPITAELDGIDIRYIRIGRVEIVRRIYAAVRDPRWRTIEPRLGEIEVKQSRDSFGVRFEARHTTSEIDFSWRGTIAGEEDGSISYDFDGHARCDMLYARIGICVHHPCRESAGRPYRARTPEGVIGGTLPTLIGPQGFKDGVYVPLFPSFDQIDIDIEPGGSVRFEFDGDLWETEDHRNWTDANFKTYSTPMAAGYPHELKEGQGLAQRVTVSIAGVPEQERRTTGTVQLLVGAPIATFPSIGLGTGRHGGTLGAGEIALLRKLGPAHLRADIRLDDEDWLRQLGRVQAECRELDCSLELALHLRANHERALGGLANALAEGPSTVRILVVLASGATATPEETTPPQLVDLVRSALQEATPSALFAGGTDLYFCELNRTRPETEAMDGVFYPIMPQMHASSDIDLVENLEAQGDTVASARVLAPGKAVIVSPVTFKGRFAYSKASGDEEPFADGLPASVDSRQVTPLGAAWTAGSLKYLADAGANSVTYFETTGLRGVIDTDDGLARSAFGSHSGQVFPLYHVLAQATGFQGAEVLACESTAQLNAVGLAVRNKDGLSVLLANLTGLDQEIAVATPGGAEREVALRPFETRAEVWPAPA